MPASGENIMLDTVFHAPAAQQPIGAVLEAAASTFRIPPLHCPFPATPCHRDVEALIERTLAWTRAFGLLPEEPGAAAKVRSYTMLAARCYPKAAFDRLAAIGDYYSWLFLFDDACEDLSLEGASPGDVHAFLSEIFAVIGVPEPYVKSGRGQVELFREALHDIWSRIARTTSWKWRDRFRRHVTNYIEGCVWEASNRLIEQTPSRAVFQSMRSYTSALYEFWDFIEFAGDFLLPDTAVEDPMIVELAATANRVTSLANDIFSLRKECSGRDIHNIVIVLEKEEALTRQAACHRAVELHDAQVRHYCALEKLLPSFASPIDQHLARYCEGMRIWMRANYDWSTVTPRYNPG
jgi:hypothetical protein